MNMEKNNEGVEKLKVGTPAFEEMERVGYELHMAIGKIVDSIDTTKLGIEKQVELQNILRNALWKLQLKYGIIPEQNH